MEVRTCMPLVQTTFGALHSMIVQRLSQGFSVNCSQVKGRSRAPRKRLSPANEYCRMRTAIMVAMTALTADLVRYNEQTSILNESLLTCDCQKISNLH